MKSFAYTLIAGGFLAATFLASMDSEGIDWPPFAAAIFTGALGVLLLRRARHGAARQGHVLEGNRATLEASLDRLVAGLEALDSETDGIPTDELRHEIDRRFRADLAAFVEARESLIHLYGLKAYAEIMSCFAAGERYLNRVWSASTDGYGEEARAYIGSARAQFSAARAALSLQAQ